MDRRGEWHSPGSPGIWVAIVGIPRSGGIRAIVWIPGFGGIWGVNDGRWRTGSMPLTPTVFIVVLITQLLIPTLLNIDLLDDTHLSDDRRVGLTGL